MKTEALLQLYNLGLTFCVMTLSKMEQYKVVFYDLRFRDVSAWKTGCIIISGGMETTAIPYPLGNLRRLQLDKSAL